MTACMLTLDSDDSLCVTSTDKAITDSTDILYVNSTAVSITVCTH